MTPEEIAGHYCYNATCESRGHHKDCPLANTIRAAVEEEREACAKIMKAAEQLCEVYFEIAEELIGEDEVRKRRDEKINAAIRRRGDR